MFDCFLDPEILKKKKGWYRSKEFQEEKKIFTETVAKDLNYEELCSTDDWQYSIFRNGSLRIINIDENTELLLVLNKLESNKTESILEEIKKEMNIMNGKILEQEQEIKNLKGQRMLPEGKSSNNSNKD